MKNIDNFTEQNFQINYEMIAEIIDNIDPEDRGRVKVRIKGLTDETVSNENLPWAETNGILISGNSDIVGISSVPDIGTYVYVNFLYGNPSFPKVTGYVRGNGDSSLLHTVKNLDSTIFKTRNDNKIGPELPPLNDKAKYPKNNVIETQTAVIEIDDTTDNKRISIQHKNGSFIEIRPDGVIQIKSKGDTYNIVDGNLEEYINNAVNIQINDNYTQNVSKNRLVQTSSTTHIGDLIVTGDLIVSGIVTASDCISGSISGNSHVHGTSPLPS